ncbi:triphosphoribosyl-dephospho-CoA synthase CitG [Levilactobacillus fujinensis]|uniref:Probable 2-(5''-triphosphoribosyl)-3'-dephosphocoenzyme-A synthase n=1 Tax=Levilactobacillus fujinensis TaxID=2486024 RepID=A0ABW1TD66_9LACO|nr:triphosphoribosyl-dephospho-CoA synthase CitG [Levilactobacillus fujinensis]
MTTTKPTETLATDALRALLYEVSVTPKPGLVDPASQGPHPDMTVFTFIDSALSLQPYFMQCVAAGTAFAGSDLTDLFSQIRPLGVDAERAMRTATNTVNTHKGAIFSLGILVTASAYAAQADLELRATVKAMLYGLTAHDFDGLTDKSADQLTAGEKLYLRDGITGIRGEAEAGYPTVFDMALPALRRSTGTLNQRLLDTLLTIVANSTDTNLVKRAGSADIVPWAHQQAQDYLALGGSKTTAGWAKLVALNQVFERDNLSLGGSADLLILTVFLGLREGIIDNDSFSL